MRVVWFTPETADVVARNMHDAHASVTSRLFEHWQSTGSDVMRCDASQPASGKYTELGIGVLPGSGRTSIRVAGENSCLPYIRNEDMTAETEPLLTEFMSDVSSVLHHALPEHMFEGHKVPSGCPPHVADAYQYPRLRKGTPPLSSHQLVIRGPETFSDLSAYLSVSDLHLDTWDGVGGVGYLHCAHMQLCRCEAKHALQCGV